MNRKTSILLSLGVSAVLIAAAIWLLYRHSAGMWMGSGRWGMGYHHMMGGGMGIVMIIFWVVLIGALVLLVSGVINGTRGSQANDDDLRKPLEILKQRFDIILLDCPPLDAAAGNATLFQLTDGVILVIKAGHLSIKILNEAIAGIPADKLVGAVLNQVKRKDMYYYYR